MTSQVGLQRLPGGQARGAAGSDTDAAREAPPPLTAREILDQIIVDFTVVDYQNGDRDLCINVLSDPRLLGDKELRCLSLFSVAFRAPSGDTHIFDRVVMTVQLKQPDVLGPVPVLVVRIVQSKPSVVLHGSTMPRDVVEFHLDHYTARFRASGRRIPRVVTAPDAVMPSIPAPAENG